MVTFSRAGFITLVAISGVMLWKFGRGSRSSVSARDPGRVRPPVLGIFRRI